MFVTRDTSTVLVTYDTCTVLVTYDTCTVLVTRGIFTNPVNDTDLCDTASELVSGGRRRFTWTYTHKSMSFCMDLCTQAPVALNGPPHTSPRRFFIGPTHTSPRRFPWTYTYKSLSLCVDLHTQVFVALRGPTHTSLCRFA